MKNSSNDSQIGWFDKLLSRKDKFFATETIDPKKFPSTNPMQDPLYVDLGFRIKTGAFRNALFRITSMSFFEPKTDKERTGDVMADFDIEILEGSVDQDVKALSESKEFTTLSKKTIRAFVEKAIAFEVSKSENKT